MIKTKRKNSRKKVFVDREVQGALMGRIVRQWMLFFVALFIAMPVWHLALSEEPFTSATQAFQDGFKHTIPVFVLLLALIPPFVFDTMKLSNRFAGPMCRLRQIMRDVADGEEVNELKFRDGDFWGDVAGDFNRMVERLREDAKPAGGENEAELELVGAGRSES